MLETLYGAFELLGIFVISGGILACGYGIYVAIKEARKKP